MENKFSEDTQDRYQRNGHMCHVISCPARWIPEVSILEEELLKTEEILLIIHVAEQYSPHAEYISTKQAVILPVHKS